MDNGPAVAAEGFEDFLKEAPGLVRCLERSEGLRRSEACDEITNSVYMAVDLQHDISKADFRMTDQSVTDLVVRLVFRHLE
jgi:hypothetical protein